MSRYVFVRKGTGTERHVEIHSVKTKTLLYSWPLFGGWHLHLTEYFVARLIGQRLANAVCKQGVQVVAELDPKSFNFPAPAVYGKLQPSRWDRIKNFFTTKKGR